VKQLLARRPVCPILVVGALALATLGCSAPDGPTTSSESTVGQESTTSLPGETTTEPAGTTPGGQFLLIGGTAIEQLTPEQGVGAYPLFEWTAVQGAARYMLFVFDTNGVMFWGWEGTATSVYLGGLDQPPTPGSMGPALDGPMSWAVIAYDAGGSLIASSAKRPVSP
jgi:hypothetical protein